MKRFDLWKLSLLNVVLTPLRSILTVLGFAIGIAAVLAVITLGEAGSIQVRSEMGRLGIDQIRITAEEGMPQGTAGWLRRSTRMKAHEIICIPSEIQTLAGDKESVTVCGCEDEFLEQTELVEGRFFRADEWDGNHQSAILGKDTADQLNVSPGDTVSIAQSLFKICGIVAAGDGVSLIPVENALIVPAEAVSGWTANTIHEIQAAPTHGLSVQAAQSLLEQAFEHTGQTVRMETMKVQMEAATSVIDTFVNVLKWVAMVCILVGGIGIMNMLLVNVRDRRREIGIMKSLGTTPGQICLLFLLEALIYGISGGLLGILLGNILIDIAGKCIELSAKAGMVDMAAVFGAAMTVGLLFGVWPAFRASRLSCVDALRQE